VAGRHWSGGGDVGVNESGVLKFGEHGHDPGIGTAQNELVK
jgi:hypothetical protein